MLHLQGIAVVIVLGWLTPFLHMGAGVDDPCPANYTHNTYDDSCIKYVDTREYWQPAEDACAVEDLGHLASVHSQDSLDFLRSFMANESSAYVGSFNLTWTDDSVGDFLPDLVDPHSSSYCGKVRKAPDEYYHGDCDDSMAAYFCQVPSQGYETAGCPVISRTAIEDLVTKVLQRGRQNTP